MLENLLGMLECKVKESQGKPVAEEPRALPRQHPRPPCSHQRFAQDLRMLNTTISDRKYPSSPSLELYCVHTVTLISLVTPKAWGFLKE